MKTIYPFKIESADDKRPQRSRVYTGLYSRKAARLLDWLFASAYAPYLPERMESFRKTVSIFEMLVFPQNMACDESLWMKEWKGQPKIHPHFVIIDANGEISYIIGPCYWNPDYFDDNDDLSPEGAMKHLNVLFLHFYKNHTAEQNAEMKRLHNVLMEQLYGKLYDDDFSDLYGNPFDMFKGIIAQKCCDNHCTAREERDDAKWQWWKKLGDEHCKRVVKKYIKATCNVNKTWWKLMLLLD